MPYEFARATFVVAGPPRKVSLHVLTLLEPSVVGPFDLTTANRLLNVIKVPPEFLARAATVVGPGTTMVMTQLAANSATTTTVATDFTVVTAEEPTKD